MWVDLAQAFCLMLVIEGIIPFIAPQRWREVANKLAHTDDGSMRLIGLVSMLIGAGCLYFLKA